MDWKQFIAEIVSSFVWPCVAVAFLVVFRTELSKIIQRLAHLKYKDLELEFDKVRQQAEELPRDVSGERPAVRSSIFSSLEDQIFDTVERSPLTAILLAWFSLEIAMTSAVGRLGISPESPSYTYRTSMHNIEVLTKNNRLPQSHGKLIQGMRMLRNKVAYERESMIFITQEQALNYAQAAIAMINYLEKLNGKANNAMRT